MTYMSTLQGGQCHGGLNSVSGDALHILTSSVELAQRHSVTGHSSEDWILRLEMATGIVGVAAAYARTR